jgi:adenylate cyclase
MEFLGDSMATQEVKRKLTAILSADVKGYSRLMGEDEEWTVHTLTAYKVVMGGLIQQHRGRVVGTAGDSVLAEFASVVDAVQCGVEIQQVLRAKNAMLPENRRMEFRIGINLGDVIEEGDTIYGDGVNIASRLEGLAEAGGICISESAYQQIENKLPLRYDYLGEHEVKNIAKPVRVYRARIEPEAVPPKLAEEKQPVQKRLSKAALAIIVVIVIAGLIALYQFGLRSSPSKTEVASKEKMAFPLPDVPSIAVMPFVNMSEDPKQEFFSDGITEEIITALSKTPKLFVIARHSTFSYKGKPVKAKQVGRELGVRYVLEGSVRKAGDKVRITAQLIDVTTEQHIWAERYDRDLRDIFAIQDEITLEIVKAMQVELTTGETARVTGKGTRNLDAYLKALNAQEQWLRMDKEGSIKARQLATEAIDLDPEYGYPYAIMAWCYMLDVVREYTRSPKESMSLAVEAVRKALALDESDYRIHRVLSNLYVMQGKHDEAIASSKRAIELCPGGAGAYENLGIALLFACRPSEAIPMLEKAIELDPFPPAVSHRNLAMAYRHVGRYEDAIVEGKKAFQINPNDLSIPLGLVIAYAKLGRKEEARAAAAEVLRIDPEFSLDSQVQTTARMFATKCHSDRVYEDFELIRKADVGLK